MKKVLSIVLAVVMLATLGLALAGCSKGGSEPQTQADVSAPAAAKTGMTITEGKLIMATNATFPPYEYIEGDDGVIIGIDPEIAGLIAEKLGLELDIQNVEFDSIIAGVQSGKYDIGMAGMTATDERRQSVNFSSTYANAVQVVIVPEDSEIADIDDMLKDGSMKYGVQQGTTGAIYAEDTYGTDNVVNYKNGPDAVQALLTGKVDAVIIDNEPAKAYVVANEGLKILETAFENEEYAICMNKDNTELLNAVNGALNELIADGTVQSIIDKYINTNEAETVSEAETAA